MKTNPPLDDGELHLKIEEPQKTIFNQKSIHIPAVLDSLNDRIPPTHPGIELLDQPPPNMLHNTLPDITHPDPPKYIQKPVHHSFTTPPTLTVPLSQTNSSQELDQKGHNFTNI